MIPIVDISRPAAEAAAAIRAACRDTGFFYAVGHGVAPGLIAGQFAWARRLFELPLEEKMALHMERSQSFAGYEPVAAQTLEAGTPPDLKEAYYCGPDLPDEHPYVRAKLRSSGKNQWPASLPGFRDHTLRYESAVRDLGMRLMRLIARSLSLPDDWFVPLFDNPEAVLRMIHYPPQPVNAAPDQLGAGAHTDWGGITLLAQDDIGGLEVRTASGEWVQATPVAGSFVINLGDLMQRWTNDLYRSNLHRVRNPAAGRDRYSIPYFFGPDHHARIECLPTCQGPDNPPRHGACTTGEHLMEMFELTYGKKAGKKAAA